MKQSSNRFVLPETTLLVALCMMDMFYTIYLVRSGIAHEANPLLRSSLAYSDWAFILVKGSSFMIPVIGLELIRPRNPKFVAGAIRFGLVAYMIVYVAGSIGLRGMV